ncbi:unnamed protein product [Callosobruchus maculatus]|uniref:Sm domain-containing protein n=1 Tax=Callosobruchus maculatus TaxID=64391 RepID=A0A653CXN3_CALMS|nr:unnamed protein product [Callosobruchus maculatus]
MFWHLFGCMVVDLTKKFKNKLQKQKLNNRIQYFQKSIMERPVSKREKYFYRNNLVCVVKSLEGIYTTIDLRNETYVTGKIVRVDGFMNVDMVDAIFCDSRGNYRAFSDFFINSRTIRYVHVPKEYPAMQMIEMQLGGMKGAKTKKKPLTFKTSRAQKYQKETLQALAAAQSQPGTSANS